MLITTYNWSLAKLSHAQPAEKAYRANSLAISGNDGDVCAALAVEGFSDGAEERLLVYRDCFDRSPKWRTGSGREGALLDWAALG